MQQKTITALEIFEQGLTKSDIKQMAENAFESVKEQGNILKVAEAASAMQLFVKELLETDGFKDYVREEAGKYGKSYTSSSGAKIQLQEVGTKYDFSKCNDSELDLLEMQMETIKDKIDQKKNFLKNIPIEGIDWLDKVTGEMVRMYPPSKTSTSSYVVTLAK